MKKNLLARFFIFISETIMGAERSILDLLSTLAPWAVPVIPAYLTFFHTNNPRMLAFPDWVAWTAAFVVEVLGLASVSTAIRFYANNRKYTKSENKAPFMLAVFVYLFYLVVTISVNVLLEIFAQERSPEIIWAIALFMLLGIPAGILISIRSQYGEMLEEREIRHAERVMAKGGKLPASQQGMGFSNMGQHQKYASDYKEKILAMLDDNYYARGKILEPREITAKLNLDHTKNKGYVSTLRSEWKRSKNIQ